jgi:hypothetical protein
LDLVLGVE